MKKVNKKNGGFTLIEILVVIGIIAVLAAIVLVALNPARQFKQARNTQRTSNVTAILNAIGQHIADNKGVLTAEIDGTAGTFQDISDAGADLCDVLVPKYMPALPFDPNATTADCTTALTYDTGYEVDKDANGRITVKAIGENPDAAGNIDIVVTR